MIEISQLKLPVDHSKKAPIAKALKLLRLDQKNVKNVFILKRSVDARKKPEIYYIYTVIVDTGLEEAAEQTIIKKSKNKNIKIADLHEYQFPKHGKEKMADRPVVIGMGPAGLVCALNLAKAGMRPIVLERGQAVEKRVLSVREFWNGGKLDLECNVQFGEGGAGTFSDGKLNTMVKDAEGRGRYILKTFVEYGAPEDILYVNKPHIGTDVLQKVVAGIRNDIIKYGGEVHFHTKVTGIYTANGRLTGLRVRHADGTESRLETQNAVLAIGHSARDTFEMLQESGMEMRAKSFAVGFRIEHPQSMINFSQYGQEHPEHLPAADYKLTYRAENGRGVYSFCMCPGGKVVNSSSEPGRTCVNGMSYRARDGVNANSALIVTVTPDDYGSEEPLAGMHFQRRIEEAAYMAGRGAIPSQQFRDFKAGVASTEFGEVKPDHEGQTVPADLTPILPSALNEALVEGIEAFGRKIKGFDRPDAILSGVEARTSSPVRMERNDNFESVSLKGLYPCGEGPGYAGGIMSAAMDGLKVCEVIVKKYKAFH